MKKSVALCLALLLMFNMSFAAGFTDLDNAKWAEPYINRLAELGILTGYPDNTYRPLGDVSKYAAVLVMFRTLDAQGLINSEDVKDYKNQYVSTFAKYSVPNWPMLHEAVAYLIEKKILAPEELGSFTKGGKNQPISRQDMARYLGKSLNQFFKDDINQVISLDYKDIEAIEYNSLRYVNILSNHGIISGDDQGNFNPTDSLNRAALAKLLVTSYDELEKKKQDATEKVEVTVHIKLDDSKKVVFYKKGSLTESYIEVIDDGVEVLIAGEKASYDDLVVEMPAVLTFMNNKLVKVTVDKKPVVKSQIKGIVTELIAFKNKYFLYLKDEETAKIKFLELSNKIEVFKVDKPASAEDIKKDDVVTVELLDNVPSSVVFKPRFDTHEGILKAVDQASRSITMTTQTGELTLKIEPFVNINRNEEEKTIVDLLAGDVITASTDMDVVQKIVATGSGKKDSGVISKIAIDREFVIEIDDANGNSKTYTVPQDALVKIDGEDKNYFDLRTGYTVSILLKNNIVTQIDASTKANKGYIVGVIKKIVPETKSLIVKGDETYTVDTNKYTIFVDDKGNKFTFSQLKVADKIFAYGNKNNYVLNVTQIMLLSK